jgi:hypothetical protein
VEPDPILAPVLATDDDFEFTTEEGMERVRYPETLIPTVR